MKIESNRATIDNVELRALAAVGAMALGQKKLAELILKNQFDVEKLNGEIRESCGEFLKNFTTVSMEPDIAEASQKVVDDILFKNSQERTE